MATRKAAAAAAFANEVREANPLLAQAIPPINLMNWGDAYNMIAGDSVLRNQFRLGVYNQVKIGAVEGFRARNKFKALREEQKYTGAIKDMWVGMVDVFPYELTNVERNEFKREITDIWEALYVINLERYYKQTLGDVQFYEYAETLDGVARIIDILYRSQYASLEMDNQILTINLFGDALLKGKFFYVPVDMTDPVNLITAMQDYSDYMEDPHREYNALGLPTNTPRDMQMLIFKTSVLHSAQARVQGTTYHDFYVQFPSDNVQTVESFSTVNLPDRLAALNAINPGIKLFTATEKSLLDSVLAIMIDTRMFRIFDNLIDMREKELASTMERNVFLHTWQTYATCPWYGGIAFVDKATAVVTEPNVLEFTVVQKSTDKAGTVTIDTEYTSDITSLVQMPLYEQTDAFAAGGGFARREGSIIFEKDATGAVMTAMVGTTVYTTGETTVTPAINVGDKITFTKS